MNPIFFPGDFGRQLYQTATKAAAQLLIDLLPTGGLVGQVLAKTSSSNYAVMWDYERYVKWKRGKLLTLAWDWVGNNTPQGSTSGAGTSEGATNSSSLAGVTPGAVLNNGTDTNSARGSITGPGIFGSSNRSQRYETFARIEMTVAIQIPTLADATNDFVAVFGLTSRANAGDAETTGAYFSIERGVLKTKTNNGTSSSSYTWPTAIVTTEVYALRLVYTASSVEFYVNDVLIQTMTDFIPQAGSCRAEVYSRKTAGNSSRSIIVARARFEGEYF